MLTLGFAEVTMLDTASRLTFWPFDSLADIVHFSAVADR